MYTVEQPQQQAQNGTLQLHSEAHTAAISFNFKQFTDLWMLGKYIKNHNVLCIIRIIIDAIL